MKWIFKSILDPWRFPGMSYGNDLKVVKLLLTHIFDHPLIHMKRLNIRRAASHSLSKFSQKKPMITAELYIT